MFNPRDLAAVQAAAQQQAYEAAVAFANDHSYYGHQHQQSIANNYNNKM
jgi:hypothetical protein